MSKIEPQEEATVKVYATTVSEARALYHSGPEGRAKIISQGSDEAKARAVARRAEAELPETPALTAINIIHEEGMERTMTKSTNGKTGTAGGRTNMDDNAVKAMIREFAEQGKTTVGAITKEIKGTDRGTNAKRLARLLAEVQAENGPKKVPAAGAPKTASARKSTAGSKDVTPRPKTPRKPRGSKAPAAGVKITETESV